MTRTTVERKLVALLNLPDLTAKQIDLAFKENGKAGDSSRSPRPPPRLSGYLPGNPRRSEPSGK
ncbi:MAG TPA: hypothetical protein VMN36_02490 [Verrucomicrobiales bacterium]|nr:hypothetical protein [Verrucomicrobiales bacterium]